MTTAFKHPMWMYRRCADSRRRVAAAAGYTPGGSVSVLRRVVVHLSALILEQQQEQGAGHILH